MSTTPAPAQLAHYATPLAITLKLQANGYSVEDVQVSTIEHWSGITVTVNFVLNGVTEESAGINMFASPAAVEEWKALNQRFGGVAVVGDNWALSLPTDTPALTANSRSIVDHLAVVLSGEVLK